MGLSLLPPSLHVRAHMHTHGHVSSSWEVADSCGTAGKPRSYPRQPAIRRSCPSPILPHTVQFPCGIPSSG